MDQGWVKIYSSYELKELEMIHTFLKEEEIDAVILNKQDSMYLTLNSLIPVELYVKSDNVIRAKYIIDKRISND